MNYTVVVEVLKVTTVYVRGLNLGSSVVRLVNNLARHHVLHLGANKSTALARLDVLELDNRPQLSVNLDDDAVLDISGTCHGDSSFGRFVGYLSSVIR